jgi:hypothetical protein
VDKGELLKFQAELEKMSKHMKTRFDICLYDAIDCRWSRQATQLEREYPDCAVGIEEPLKEVVKLLEWESEKNAVAVMVYGFGGVGKSTLADAVFARLDIVGCKYSMVRLFDDITSTPNIVEKQKCILRDLTMGIAEERVVRTFESGQREIRHMLEKEVAFIYIDNVLDGDMLQQLLPRDMLMAKKVRVLITARDKSVRRVCTMETKDYSMNGLPRSEATVLLKKEMKEGGLASNQLNQIIEICGGIPKLLTVVAGFIKSEEDKQKAFRIVMGDKKHLKGQAFGDIEHYVFAYDRLPERCKEPLLDICIFFKGMDWDYVADIVGESELDMLEKRALVSKDKNMDLRVHDVILKIVNKRAEETRFNFTNADRSQFEDFLEKESKVSGLMYMKIRVIYLQ